MIPRAPEQAWQYCRVALLALVLLPAYSHSYSYKKKALPEPVKLSVRLQALFIKTKLVCFGRYALEVPQEAELIPSNGDINVISGGLDALKLRVAADIAKIKEKDKTAEITYDGEGPIKNSWQVRYYDDDTAKKYGLHFFNTYVNKGDLTFVLGDAVGEKDTEEMTALRQAVHAKNVRPRMPDEVPDEPGYCFRHGFMAENLYAEQEMSNAGIYLPSLPDVTFSISSNKDAYADTPAAEFEKSQRGELSLLARIAGAKKDQGLSYPSRTVLREGKRDVNHWHGEESLIRRKDGVHDFEWAFVGTPKDVANPSEFGAVMFTKVEHNAVGAAKVASVSDDEAVALWDKLLSGLKFRVKVPGAPEGSYVSHLPKPVKPAVEPAGDILPGPTASTASKPAKP
ncbi:T6SS immunity protein Tli4 family protein [Massilia sp. TSP1-1-2]|uniref:T6SS immunity protein Tli4 family protein n=1 Tax=Massilia sp. TSP1-1-2 TaxID=2804649 RepID=UPI003CFAC027